jgi:hypothetical protein
MDELKKIGPNLSNIKNENPFEVPERYFENFSARLSEKIHAESQLSIPRRRVLTWKPYLAAAVILIVALLAGNSFYKNTRSKKTDRLFHAEISQVVEQELYSISEGTILEVMDGSTYEASSHSEMSSEEAIDYLMNEDLNEEELLNAI